MNEIDAATQRRFDKAVEFMRWNLGATDLNGLSDMLGVSKWTVMRDFKTVADTTPGRVIAEIRLAEMQRMLRETRIPIAAVVGLLGLKSVGTACRWFKIQTGTTPARYRAEATEKVAA